MPHRVVAAIGCLCTLGMGVLVGQNQKQTKTIEEMNDLMTDLKKTSAEIKELEAKGDAQAEKNFKEIQALEKKLENGSH